MVRQMFLLVMLGTFLAIGGFWALRAQDPTPQNQNQNQNTSASEPQMRTSQSTQLDLSGTYTGTFMNCDEAGLNGETTLTITGNQFTTADGKSGRIIASKTRGYTAVALQMSGAGSKVVSFRGKKSGTKLTLTPVAGATTQCTFTPSKAGNRANTPAATGTEAASPSAMPSQSPRPSPSPEGSPMPSPSPTEPTPSPSPSEPTPSPSPGGSPSPTPTPSPSPRI